VLAIPIHVSIEQTNLATHLRSTLFSEGFDFFEEPFSFDTDSFRFLSDIDGSAGFGSAEELRAISAAVG
jgi:hypothetical protein